MLKLLWQRSEFGGHNIQGRCFSMDFLEKARETTTNPITLKALEECLHLSSRKCTSSRGKQSALGPQQWLSL